MPPKNGPCRLLTFSRPDCQLHCSCSNCREGGVIHHRDDVGLDLIIIRGPEAIILTVYADGPLFYRPAGIMRCSAAEAYDRVHPSHHVIRPTIVSNEISTLIAYGFSRVGYDNQGGRMGYRDKA